MLRPFSCLSNKRGFTLLEIILSSLIMAILFAVTSIIITKGMDSYIFASDREGTLDDVRYAVDRVTREVQRLGSGQLTSITSTQINFTDTTGTATNFRVSGSSLYRGNDLLLSGLSSMAFTGYDSTGTSTAQASQVRRILFTLSVLPTGQSTAIKSRTNIFMRNFMYLSYL